MLLLASCLFLLLAVACADRLGPDDLEALKRVEEHIEEALRDENGDVAPTSVVDPVALEEVVHGPIDSSFLTHRPSIQDTATTTPPPLSIVKPADPLGEVPP